MSYLPVEPPAFFHRGPSPLARLTFVGLVSVVLLFADTRFHYLEGVRAAAAVALYPLQRVARLPGEAVDWIGTYFLSLRELAAQNAELQRELVAQAPAAQGYLPLREENARLKALLDVQARFADAATAAQVLYTGRDPFSQKVFVDKGADAGVTAGEAVIDDAGVIGQLTRTYPFMGEVTLITDKDHAVPVKVERSGVRSVLFGNGAGRPLELRFMAASADVQVGDLLLTSGIDATYPPGLAVARIDAIVRETGQMFASITASPVAGVDRSEYLLILRRSTAVPSRPEEVPGDEAVKKAGKAKRKG